jgi:acetylglutamate kinase
MIYVIKIGGEIIDTPENYTSFLDACVALPGRKIIVHGGGKMATRLAEQLGIPTQLVEGRRITDAQTLQVVTMTYAGWIGKTLVAGLQQRGCIAFSLCGADGNLIRSSRRKVESIDYGFVGDLYPDSIHTTLLLQLLNMGITPVLSAITHDGKGQLLNTNADTVAANLAMALQKEEQTALLLGFGKPGVLQDSENEKSFLPTLTIDQADNLKQSGKIHSGMLPKIKAGFEALEAGVDPVLIGHAKHVSASFLNTKLSTRLVTSNHD